MEPGGETAGIIGIERIATGEKSLLGIYFSIKYELVKRRKVGRGLS